MKSIITLGLFASLALCQEDVVIFNRQIAPGTGPDKTVTFFANGPQKLVKNAPYMADSITESVQVLSDGNRIVNSNKSSFARDSEGRTRRENTIQSLGAVGSTPTPIVSVFIEDPVAELTYSLDPRAKVAFKSASGIMTFKTKHDAEDALSTRITKKVDEAIHTRIEKKIETHVLSHDVIERRLDGPAIAGSDVRVEVMVNSNRALASTKRDNVRKEDLGNRTIEGVTARGTRTILTIPAGEAGNERPIEVATESWYSEEIKAMVLNVHTDPRMGTVTTKLSNLRLGEPSKSLFEPPADYKIEEGINVRKPMEAIRIREEI